MRSRNEGCNYHELEKIENGIDDSLEKKDVKSDKTVFYLFGSMALLVIIQVFLFFLIYLNTTLYGHGTPFLQGTVFAKASDPMSISKKSEWDLWDRKTVIQGSAQQKCRWTDFFVPTSIKGVGDKEAIPICVHPQKDLISDEIVNTGYWGKCAQLPYYWNEAISNFPQNMDANTSKKNSNLFFVDVGANLGSCILHILFSTEAKVVAIEPNLDNLFCLTNTLLKFPPSLRNRVFLYPIALGDHSAIDHVYAEYHNMGNSMISKMVGTPTSMVNKMDPVPIQRLDQVLDMEALTKQDQYVQYEPFRKFPLVKISAQGSECQILQGMNTMLPHVQMLIITINNSLLKEFACEPQFIFDFLTNHHYRLFIFEKDMNMERVIDKPLLRAEYDLIARLAH